MAAGSSAQNPVRAGLAASPGDYPWSSARAHVTGSDDPLVKAAPLLKLKGNREDLLPLKMSAEEARRLRG
jgi:REP-associated tyrosine transposase